VPDDPNLTDKDIFVRRGDTWRRNARLRLKVGRTPIDLTGSSFAGSIVSSAGATLATFTCTILSAAEGRFELLMSDATTTAIPAGVSLASYTVRWTTAAGDVRTIMRGAVYLS
jgi:hypothetical protein